MTCYWTPPGILSEEAVRIETRRQLFARGARGLGLAALATLLGEDATAAGATALDQTGGLPYLPHFAPKAKRAIYLHMVGAPPQMETFDYKPELEKWLDKDLPDSIRKGQRLTTMTSGQERFPIVPSAFKFQQHGQSGAWISELLPYTASMADDLAIIRSMHTEAINHEPAITFIQTGREVAGRPCIGSWLAYGLGSMNRDLPTFVVLNASHSHPKANVQAISAKLWTSGFLSSRFAGVSLRSTGDPVLYVNNPDGVPSRIRRRMLDSLAEMNRLQHQQIGDPETLSRIEQYEMAFRMQSSVPELTDLSKEPESTYRLYGEDAKVPGTFAYSCLMARRLGRAQRPLRPDLPSGMGRAPRGAPSPSQPVQGRGPGLLGAGPGLEAAGAPGGHPGDLGRRVRPYRLLPGQTHRNDLRAGSPSPLFQPLDGRGRNPGRRRPRRDRRLRVQHRARPGPCARLPGHHPFALRHRPRPLHLSLPGVG